MQLFGSILDMRKEPVLNERRIDLAIGFSLTAVCYCITS